MKMKIKLAAPLLLGIILTLAACSPLPTETVDEPTETAHSLEIQSVSVEQGVRVELTGTTTLPEGNCVYTQLDVDTEAVDWWPVGKCFPIEVPDWQISVPLGVEGAPSALDVEAAYRIRVWWPGAPDESLAEFDFDLTPPPSP
jgi:hypothetical protein